MEVNDIQYNALVYLANAAYRYEQDALTETAKAKTMGEKVSARLATSLAKSAFKDYVNAYVIAYAGEYFDLAPENRTLC